MRGTFLRSVHSMAVEPLDASVHAKCARFAHKAATELALDATTFKYVKTHQNMELYQSVPTRTSPNVPFRVKAVMIVPGDLDEVLLALSKQGVNAQEYRKTMFYLLQDAFVEGVSLHNGRDMNFNWLALADENKKFDMTYMTATTRYVRRHTGLVPAVACPADIGVQIWQSIEVPELVKFSEQHTGCKRLRMDCSGFLVERTSTPAMSQVSFFLSFGKAKLAQSWMIQLAERLATIAVIFSRQGSLQLVPRSLWTFNAYCYSCFKSFGTFRRRHHCRLCGNSICSKCTVSVEVTFPSSPTAGKYDSTSVPCCSKCSDTNNQIDRHLSELSMPKEVENKWDVPPLSPEESPSPIRFSLHDMSCIFPRVIDSSPIVVLEENPLVDDEPSPTESNFFRISNGNCMRVRCSTNSSMNSTAPSSQRSSRSTLTDSDIEASLSSLNEKENNKNQHIKRLEAARLRLQLEKMNLNDRPQETKLVYLYP
ncbi:hypothetical protein THRCLA_11710 [Thraustotheca clavata]|uniref:FYVE-type domain-containing protein n=1 Tax=Thraustotheca clavata TaxID=74557 RepID=A0A1V9Y6W6_9STRA|nr:hypothetical protein THRCLA_11710 [Thraustotheca clavata]